MTTTHDSHPPDMMHPAAANAASDSRFRLLADALPQLVWTADGNGVVNYYNNRAAEYAGLRPTKDGVWEWAPAVHDDDVERTVQAWTSAVRQSTTYQCEHRVQMANGDYRWHLSRGVPLFEDGRVIQWFGTATDIHVVKAAEQEMQIAARNKDEFLAVLAHELRNPLAPISNVLELMRDDLETERARRLHAILERQVSHMVRLVDDLLEISRISRGELRLDIRPVALRSVIDSAVEVVAPALAVSGLRFVCEAVSAELVLRADEVRLSQALGNLLHNAIKFTPTGGVISIDVQAIGGNVVLTVADSGVGIPPADLQRVFDMFVQVSSDRSSGRSSERGGLGIGLALVRRVVELHGGAVRAESDGEGRGSRFILTLPLATG